LIQQPSVSTGWMPRMLRGGRGDLGAMCLRGNAQGNLRLSTRSKVRPGSWRSWNDVYWQTIPREGCNLAVKYTQLSYERVCSWCLRPLVLNHADGDPLDGMHAATMSFLLPSYGTASSTSRANARWGALTEASYNNKNVRACWSVSKWASFIA
jgi:hypothetical protein